MSREIMQQALHHLVELADDLRRIPSDIAQTIAALEAELAKAEMPTKIFGPNLEQILNAAGFYRREWVGLTDEDIEGILDCDRGWLVDIKKVEQILKEKNHGSV